MKARSESRVAGRGGVWVPRARQVLVAYSARCWSGLGRSGRGADGRGCSLDDQGSVAGTYVAPRERESFGCPLNGWWEESSWPPLDRAITPPRARGSRACPRGTEGGAGGRRVFESWQEATASPSAKRECGVRRGVCS